MTGHQESAGKLKIGDLFLLGFRGETIPDWLREFSARHGLGGVILFDYDCQTRTYENNVRSPAQLRELCAELARLPGRPLVFVDQEGGKVRRLKEKLGFAPLPSAWAFNRLPLGERRALAEASFRELRGLGIHFNLAPVIDLNLFPANPDIGAVERSYSADPREVRENFEIVDGAARAARIGLSLKHFPGLGGARVNSHLELTDLTDSVCEEQLRLFYELGPRTHGGGVIVSHGIVQSWEKDTPVSVSGPGVARLRAHHPDGLLISDDLQMQALQKKCATTEACLRGLAAGIDLFCIGNNLMPEDERALDVAAAIEAAVARDRGLDRRARESVERVSSRKRDFF